MLKIDINLIFTVINVLILFAAVRVFLWKPIHKILAERQAQADKQLADAAAAKAEAEKLQQQRKDELNGVEEEKAQIMEEARKNAGTAYDQIVAEAHDEARNILKKAEEEAEREKKAAMHEAESEIRDMVLTATARVIGSQSGNDEALYDRFLEKVGADGDTANS